MTKSEVDRVIAEMEALLRNVPSLCLHPGCDVVAASYCVRHQPKRVHF